MTLTRLAAATTTCTFAERRRGRDRILRQTPAELTGTGKADTMIVIVNLDGHNAHQSIVHIELGDFGFATDKPLKVHDELTGRDFEWGYDNYVSLAPWADVAHVLTVVED